MSHFAGRAARVLQRARAGDGPTLIEADTMRMRGHAIHDDAKYVPPEMFAKWEKRDPILLWGQRLRKAKLLDDALDEQIIQEVRAEVDEATGDAMAQPEATPGSELGDVFA